MKMWLLQTQHLLTHIQSHLLCMILLLLVLKETFLVVHFQMLFSLAESLLRSLQTDEAETELAQLQMKAAAGCVLPAEGRTR